MTTASLARLWRPPTDSSSDFNLCASPTGGEPIAALQSSYRHGANQVVQVPATVYPTPRDGVLRAARLKANLLRLQIIGIDCCCYID